MLLTYNSGASWLQLLTKLKLLTIMAQMTYKYTIYVQNTRFGSAWGYQNAYNLKRKAQRKYKGASVTMERTIE